MNTLSVASSFKVDTNLSKKSVKTRFIKIMNLKTKLLTICLLLFTTQVFANRYLPHPSDPSLGETFILVIVVGIIFAIIGSFKGK